MRNVKGCPFSPSVLRSLGFREASRSGGLPRVAELFEALKPKEAAEIAKIDGIVSIGGTIRAKK